MYTGGTTHVGAHVHGGDPLMYVHMYTGGTTHVGAHVHGGTHSCM